MSALPLNTAMTGLIATPPSAKQEAVVVAAHPYADHDRSPLRPCFHRAFPPSHQARQPRPTPHSCRFLPLPTRTCPFVSPL